MAMMICLSVALSVTLCLAGCGSQNTGSDGEKTVEVTVVEVGTGYLVVSPVSGSPELASSDCFSLSNPFGDDVAVEVGDLLRIVYCGGIRETYPAGFERVVEVTLTDPTGEGREISVRID